MFRTNFAHVVRQREYEWKRHLSLRTIAKETGLSINTVARVSRGQIEKVHLATIEILCRYFRLTSIADLIEIDPASIPSEPPTPT